MPERYRVMHEDAVGEIVPGAGFGLTSFLSAGEEHLALPMPLPAFMMEAHTGGAPLLYPWANRLRGDRYTFEGTEVDLSDFSDLKRDGNGLPMHGLLLRFNDWEIEVLENGIAGSITWGDHSALMRAFPFDHRLRIVWTLEPQGFRSTIEVEATTCDMPVAAGWHPFLAPPVQDRRNLAIDGPALTSIPLDGDGLPTGEEGERCHESGPLGSRTFDNLYSAPQGGFAFAIKGDATATTIESDGTWRGLQLYATPTGHFVAVEPMVAPTAALSDGSATTVRAGETFTASFVVGVAKNACA